MLAKQTNGQQQQNPERSGKAKPWERDKLHLLLRGPTAQICRNNLQVGNLCCLGPLFTCRSRSSRSFPLCSPLKQFSAQLRDGTCSVSEDTPQWTFASKERATWNQTWRTQPQTRSQLHSHHTESAHCREGTDHGSRKYGCRRGEQWVSRLCGRE